MQKLSTETKLSGADVIQRAVAFFGPSGVGLKVTEQTDGGVSFEGGGGGVAIEIFPGDKGKTNVEISSREWEFQSQQFLEKIR